MGVCGVILAAGSSARLGRPKQLLELDGETIVHVVVRNAMASKLDGVVLVTGSQAAQVTAAAGDLGQRTVFNSRFHEGQSTSLIAGLSAVPPDATAALFLLGDQPEVGPEIIDAVIERFEASGAAIVQPVYGSTPSNPVLFSRALFPELLRLTGDEGGRSLIKRHAGEVLRVPVATSPPPADIDTEADYRALVERWTRRKRTAT